MVFEALKIDNTLEAAEKTAIDNLKIDGTNTAEIFKTALKNEKIAWVDQKFVDIATAFSTYNVEFSVTEGTTAVKSEPIAKCNETAPQRLKTLIADKDSNDLVYFMYKISVLLKVGEEKDLEKETFGLKTIQQLKNLKTEIEKPATTEVGDTTKLEAKDITFTLYSWVTPDQVVTAGEKLKIADPTLAKKIIPLLKSGDIKGVQEALSMTNDATELYKKADGKFGKRTLTNLEAGKIIEQKEAGNTKTGTKEKDENKTIKDYTINMYNKPYIFKLNETTISDLEYLKSTYGLEKTFWDIQDRFDSDDLWDLTDFPLKYDFVQSIKKYFEKDDWKKEKNTKWVAYATIEEYIDGMWLHTLVEKIKNSKDGKQDWWKTEKTPIVVKDKIEKPINQDVFNTYIEQLQANIDKTDYFATITDTKLIQTLWITNGQQKKVRKLTLVKNNYSYNNPYIGVKITEAGKEYDQTFSVFKINLAEFTEKNPSWSWRKVDTLSFYRNIDKYMLEDINKKEKDKVQTDITSNYYKTVEQIKWKKYALNDLFPNIDEYEKAQYESFFKTFGDDKKLEIHNDSYVHLSPDKKKLYLDLNQNGADKTYAEKLEFTMSEISDSQWKFQEDAFKKKLANYVTSMVNEHFSV